MTELRCENCNRKIGEAVLPPGGKVKIQCRRCGYMNHFSPVREPLRPEGFGEKTIRKEVSPADPQVQ